MAVSRTIRMDGGAAAFPSLNTMAIVGMSAAAQAMSEEQRTQVSTAITNDSVDAARSYVDGSDLVFELATIMATARS